MNIKFFHRSSYPKNKENAKPKSKLKAKSNQLLDFVKGGTPKKKQKKILIVKNVDNTPLSPISEKVNDQ